MKYGKNQETFRHCEWQDNIKYIAGPISHGDMEENVQRAIVVGEFYYRQGFSCYIPHLDYHWIQQYPKPYDDLTRLSMGILMRLTHEDELVRIPGYSPGSDAEIEAVTRMTSGPSIKIMTVVDCEDVEEALGESFPYLPPGQINLSRLTEPLDVRTVPPKE